MLSCPYRRLPRKSSNTAEPNNKYKGPYMAFTYFFRDLQSLKLVRDHLVDFATGLRKIRIWDAGCATGEEPYTFAILMAEGLTEELFDKMMVYATDYEREFAEIVREGVYLREQIDRVPPELAARYFDDFDDEPGKVIIKEKIRDKVEFDFHDLTTLTPIQTGVSLIICKNVLLHFSPETRVRVLRMFYQALLPGGMLLMEHTQKLPEQLGQLFTLVTPRAQLVRKKG